MATITNRREDIYEAAADLFRTKGFAATSMRDLARAVNLTASSLYNHINSKEQILQEICFATARKFETGMDEVEGMQGTCADKIRALIRQHIHIAVTDRTSITAFNDEWRHLSEPFLSDFKTHRRDYEQRFQRILEEGIQEGEFQPYRTTLVLYTLLSSIRWLYDWFEHDREISLAEVEAEVLEIVMRGIERT
jgi:AcrR family transcriptional regulator